MSQDDRSPAPEPAAIARRAAARQLACPYCQDALVARWRTGSELQLLCPSCGFTELPDPAPSGAGLTDRPSPA